LVHHAEDDPGIQRRPPGRIMAGAGGAGTGDCALAACSRKWDRRQPSAVRLSGIAHLERRRWRHYAVGWLADGWPIPCRSYFRFLRYSDMAAGSRCCSASCLPVNFRSRNQALSIVEFLAALRTSRCRASCADYL